MPIRDKGLRPNKISITLNNIFFRQDKHFTLGKCGFYCKVNSKHFANIHALYLSLTLEH